MNIDPQNLFFSSDFHYSHTNICKGVSKWGDTSACRDFATLEEMNEAIVNSINMNVPKDGTLFHLGDWSFGGYNNVEKLRSQIHCENIYHCYGNHDDHIRRSEELQSLFHKCFDYMELRIGKKLVVLTHYSFRVWRESHKGSYNLYGHSHGSLPPLGRSLDVGWDSWCRPLAWEEIDAMLRVTPVHYIDHHSSTTNP